MNHKCNLYYLQLRKLLLLAMAAVLLSACDSAIYDEEGDCSVVYKVRFRYDKNLKWADAFPNEVKSVNLYAYDEEGNLVWQNFESGELLAGEGYAMTLNLKPGKYHLLAWCGLNNDGSRPETFSVPQVFTGEKNMKDLTATLMTDRDEDATAVSDRRLWPLYHGETDIEILSEDEAEPGVYTETILLTKDTNHIRVILQQLSTEDLDVNDFVFEIECDNGYLDCHNEVIPTEKIRYSPWDTHSGQAGVGKEDTRAIVMVNGAIADLTVSRMTADDPKAMRLSIYDKKKEKRIARIPVIDYALLAKSYYESEYHHAMSDQDFLDREDEYTFTLFIDDDHEWLSANILIHSWVVVPNDVDLH